MSAAAEQEEALRWFIRTLTACGGDANATEYRENPLNVFCDDFRPLDTFNLAIERGLTQSSHNSDFDTSIVRLTDEGRAYAAQSSNEQSGSRRCEATCAGKEELDELKFSQARATAAEGEMPSREEIARVVDPHGWKTFDRQLEALISAGYDPDKERGRWMYVNDSLAKADSILALRKPSSAQQTITQLTRELETARKVLEPFAWAAGDLGTTFSKTGKPWELPDDTHVDLTTERIDGASERTGADLSLGQLRAAASFLSSLSHQETQQVSPSVDESAARRPSDVCDQQLGAPLERKTSSISEPKSSVGAKNEPATTPEQLKAYEAALQKIARGLTPPDQHGHYLAHRECVHIARQALKATT